MAWQRAARRLRDLGLIEYEPRKERRPAYVRRTRLGQKVALRYWEELALDRPIRWPQATRRRSTPAQRARLADLTAHIEELCANHNVKWTGSATTAGGVAWPASRHMRCPRIKSRVNYFVALHELGHLVLGTPDEKDAWGWAIDTARVRPTQAVKAAIRRGLRSHGIEDWDEP